MKGRVVESFCLVHMCLSQRTFWPFGTLKEQILQGPRGSQDCRSIASRVFHHKNLQNFININNFSRISLCFNPKCPSSFIHRDPTSTSSCLLIVNLRIPPLRRWPVMVMSSPGVGVTASVVEATPWLCSGSWSMCNAWAPQMAPLPRCWEMDASLGSRWFLVFVFVVFFFEKSLHTEKWGGFFFFGGWGLFKELFFFFFCGWRVEERFEEWFHGKKRVIPKTSRSRIPKVSLLGLFLSRMLARGKLEGWGWGGGVDPTHSFFVMFVR